MTLIKSYLFCIVMFILVVVPINAHEFHQRLGIGINVDAIRLVGGEKGDSRINGWGGLSISYGVTPTLTLAYENSYGWVRPRKPGSYIKTNPDEPFKTFLFRQHLYGIYYFPRMGAIHPFITAGTGLLQWDLRNVAAGGSFFENGLRYGDRVYDRLYGM